tara:strand:- start:119 stop:505 length:387 start_codon:yes stop_codon:yes gene_type:complete
MKIPTLIIPELEGTALEIKRMKFIYGLLAVGVRNGTLLSLRRKEDPCANFQEGVHYGSWSEIELANELEKVGLCSNENVYEVTVRLLGKLERQRLEVDSDWDVSRSGVPYHNYTIAKDFPLWEEGSEP